MVPVAHGVFLLLAPLQGHLLTWMELRGCGGGCPGGGSPSSLLPSILLPSLSLSLSHLYPPSLFSLLPTVFLGSPWFLTQAKWMEFNQCGRL